MTLSAHTRAEEQAVECPRVSLDTPAVHIEHFVEWLLGHDDIDKTTIPRLRLLTLYAEYCEYHDVKLLSPGRFDRCLKSVGFQRLRLSTPGRPWMYSLKRPTTAYKLKRPRPSAVPLLRHRSGR
jgi:hypothetical protein